MNESESRIEPLFTWVHLSDIHIGHGDASYGLDQQLVLAQLKEDIKEAIQDSLTEYLVPIPKPDAFFVTGDLAFSGNKKEYQVVSQWLSATAGSISVSNEQIFLVPGNHDVQRTVALKSSPVRRLLDDLRSGREKLDNALANKVDWAMLTKGIRNYLEFAKAFGPTKDGELFWVHGLPSRGINIRIAGLNTALLSADKYDKGKLQLGQRQIYKALIPYADKSNEVEIWLSHHPFDWLGDGKNASDYVRKADIHLCGHIHEASSESLRRGGGKDFVQVVSGAAHGDPADEHKATGHGYNFGAIGALASGQLVLRVWPRVWVQDRTEFLMDIPKTDKGKQFAEHPLDPRLRHLPQTPSSRRSSWSANGKPKGKIVLIYSERDRGFLDSSTLIKFFESLATQEKLDFSWDRDKLGHAEIKNRLDAADIVVPLVSKAFLESNYAEEVESKIKAGRQKNQRIIVVPVLLDESSWKKHKWISKNQPLPEDGYIIHDHKRGRNRTFKAIIDDIRIRIRNRRQAVVSTAPAEAFYEPRALYTLRRLPDSSFTTGETEKLVADSIERAEKSVRDPKKRKVICEGARQEIKKNEGQPLSKRQLEELDKRFLARGKRNPDAEIVRWVLRAARLHPQGRVAG
jgi:Calcineurin-like phosphoesterase